MLNYATETIKDEGTQRSVFEGHIIAPGCVERRSEKSRIAKVAWFETETVAFRRLAAIIVGGGCGFHPHRRRRRCRHRRRRHQDHSRRRRRRHGVDCHSEFHVFPFMQK